MCLFFWTEGQRVQKPSPVFIFGDIRTEDTEGLPKDAFGHKNRRDI